MSIGGGKQRDHIKVQVKRRNNALKSSLNKAIFIAAERLVKISAFSLKMTFFIAVETAILAFYFCDEELRMRG